MEKAARLFRKKGYAASSIRDIAKAMDMEAASLYNHIKSKQEILEVILIPLAERYTKGINEITKAPIPSIEKLERIIADQIRITIENPDFVSLVPGEWVHLEDSSREKYLKLRNNYEKQFKKVFSNAIAEGDIKEVNVEIATFSILSTLRWLFSWYTKNKKVNPVVLETELINNLIGGLRMA